ncbi:ParB N-terminal domain-containing protein [Alcaligenes sp. NLF5-7]|uniref:ParB family protein n=1 Tax=Alcaligenes sp. NLF5-7 TaxID=2918755 RepID=UPI0020C4FC91|nr:ParB family protein [Alcaligenes sp. NLF5-7]UTM01261.1 ParB N-terminal domain-containing protein [Alcaligenes sp. NLF5-7]
MSKTPELLTASQRAAQLRMNAELSSTSRETSPVSSKKSNYQDIAKRSLMGTPPPLNAMGAMTPMDVVDGSISNLAITDIDRYEFDPRTEINPLYDEIKASIRANGILNHISVTRRPGQPRYMVYGGGNTRLRIAKELYEEGDQRFARLTVIVKVWKGDAPTIAAHLAENEQRGDISFWEKAQGVLSFKEHFEKESGKTLSTTELNRELRQASGLNFGMSMLQNFLFAVEYLAPIGPWLKISDVNLVLKPRVTQLLKLADKFNQQPIAETALQTILHKYAALLSQQSAARQLSNRTSAEEVSDRDVPALLQVEQLLEEVTIAVAAALEVIPDKLLAMAQALEANPRMAVETLTLIEATVSTSVGQSSAVPEPSIKQTPTQPPLGRMLASVPAPMSKPDSSGGAFLPVSPSVSQSVIMSGESEGFDPQPIFTVLGEFQSLIDMSDVLFKSDQPHHIFGFYLDFPAQGIGYVDGIELEPELVIYRKALWKILISLTGQLDRRFTQLIPHEADGFTIAWKQLWEQGEEQFQEGALELLGEAFDHVSLQSVSLVLRHEQLGPLVTRLLTEMERVRTRYPERQLDGFMPLFMPDVTEEIS